jgi:hypothetical protein
MQARKDGWRAGQLAGCSSFFHTLKEQIEKRRGGGVCGSWGAVCSRVCMGTSSTTPL